ncbi:hypothetical protein RHDC4_01026 [Rhodocyclaceae bacterium]|nr:hypothetical protein RHDC4_01026 [Rhodocyclaceae bacterium]
MVRMFLSAVTIMVLVMGCGRGPESRGQREIAWADQHLLFLADGRNGQVRVFDLRNGPVPRASLSASGRRSVADMELDPARAQHWVLGDDALYRYDARRFVLLDRRALPTNTGPERALELDGDGVPVLLAAGLRIRLLA